jgi:hypothetical protein
MAAGPASAESSMEARIARLESDVAHLRTDVADIKVDVRSLRDRMDTLGTQLNTKIDGLKDSLATTTVWALLLFIALAGAMLGTMARGFGWI